MTNRGFGEWFARGEAERLSGHPIDALICYRQALQLNRYSVQAQFHAGEVLQQLGRRSEAFDAWRAALTWQPGHVASLLAFGTEARRIGNPTEATEAFRRVLAIEPQNRRARRGLALARLALDDWSLAGELPGLLAADDGGGSAGAASDGDAGLSDLAQLLEDAPATPPLRALLSAVGAAPGLELPPLLLALCAEESARDAGPAATARARALLDRAAALIPGADDPETLRHLALAVAAIDRPSPLAPSETGFAWAVDADAPSHSTTTDATAYANPYAATYAQLCTAEHARKVPLRWPRRLGGEPLRVAYLVDRSNAMRIGASTLDTDRFLRDVVAAHDRERIAASVYTVDRGGGVTEPTTASAVRGVAFTHIGYRPDEAVARVLAEADYDAIIDLAGMQAATGLLLARRPARSVWTPASLFAAHQAPLVTHALPTPDAASTNLDTYRQSIETALGDALLAEPWYRDRLALSPVEMAHLWRDAVTAHQAADVDAAVTGYRRVLEHQPGSATTHYLLGCLLRDRGEQADACRQLASAVTAAPAYNHARAALANLLRVMSAPAQAISLCRDGLELAPREPALWRALGLAELAQDHGANARDAFRRALDLAPADAETHYNLGVALQTMRRHGGATQSYQRALALDANMVAAEYNIAVVLRDTGHAAAAIAGFERVLAHSPAHVQAHSALCETLLDQRRLDEWLRAFRRFEQSCPGALPLAVQALQARQYMGDLAGVDHYLDRLRRDAFTPASEKELADCLESLLQLVLYFDIDPADMLGLYRAYDTVAPHVYGAPLTLPEARKPGKVRIGYLSGDLRNHVMGKMMWEAIRRHDRDRFECFFYSTSDVSDDWTDRYRALGGPVESIAGKSETDAAARIAADEIDLLVDLSTHTRGAAPGILALKPARVQLTHIASAGSVGLTTIDFKLTDAFADAPDNQAQQIETLLAMAGCAYPYRHIEAAATHRYHRGALGIDADAVVIGAFVNPIKLSRRCMSLWRDVLERVPQAVLAISPLTPDLVDVYRRLFAAAAIAANRVIVIPAGKDDAENQARYHVVDFTLDTLPYGGVNGTLEALDMGVPVVTLCGKRHGERTSYSILANLGVTDTVAQSGSEYVTIAVRLATDRDFMEHVRAAIGAGILRSPLTDMDAHTRNLEGAYLRALGLRYPAALEARARG